MVKRIEFRFVAETTEKKTNFVHLKILHAVMNLWDYMRTDLSIENGHFYFLSIR